MAEKEGFEPSIELLTLYSLSRGAPSATRPLLRTIKSRGWAMLLNLQAVLATKMATHLANPKPAVCRGGAMLSHLQPFAISHARTNSWSSLSTRALPAYSPQAGAHYASITVKYGCGAACEAHTLCQRDPLASTVVRIWR